MLLSAKEKRKKAKAAGMRGSGRHAFAAWKLFSKRNSVEAAGGV